MVELTVDGLNCIIANDLLSISLSETAKATSVVYGARELMMNLSGATGDPDRTNSFYCDYHVNGKTKNLIPTRLAVIADTPELAHVAYIDDQSELQLAYHLMVRDGEPAVFGYVVAGTDVDDLVINEPRTVYRFDSTLFMTGYTARRPGELVHVDVKKVARMPAGGGWRALGRGNDPSRGHSGLGSPCLHVAVDDRSGVAYAELPPDERKGTARAFMSRCLAFFAGPGRRKRRVMLARSAGARWRIRRDPLA